MTNDLTPFYDDAQAHYDLSDELFELLLDPTRTYSCAYFERGDMTLEEAQRANGLTLSQNQHDHVASLLEQRGDTGRSAEVRLQGWEDFDQPVDRIVSTERYDAFFDKCRKILPADGRILLQWSTTLQDKKDQAIAIASPEVYNTYVKYLSGCVDYFRKGYIDVMQFSLFKQQPRSGQQ